MSSIESWRELARGKLIRLNCVELDDSTVGVICGFGISQILRSFILGIDVIGSSQPTSSDLQGNNLETMVFDNTSLRQA